MEYPADLEAIVLECLEKEPSLRPKSAAELSARLAKTEAKAAFTADDARAAWERCRELMATEPIESSPPETRMTLALRPPA